MTKPRRWLAVVLAAAATACAPPAVRECDAGADCAAGRRCVTRHEESRCLATCEPDGGTCPAGEQCIPCVVLLAPAPGQPCSRVCLPAAWAN